MKQQFLFHSALSPDAVIDAIRLCADEEQWTLFSLSGYAGKRPVLVKLDGYTFRLQKRRYQRNSFAPFFFGQIQPDYSGTRIEGYFAMHPLVKVFMLFWLSVVGLALFAGTSQALRELHSGHMVQWPLLAIPAAMFVFGLLMATFGQLMGRREERFLLNFLQDTLQAPAEEVRT